MNNSFINKLTFVLKQRKNDGLYRKTTPAAANLVDFCSNDYLGLARSAALKKTTEEIYEQYVLHNKTQINGAGASRLISGNHELYDMAEKAIAKYHKSPAALIYNSGYAANTGLLPAITERGDIVVYDEQIHASIRDGLRLCHCKSYSFEHNDPDSLVKRLEFGKKNIGQNTIFIVVESLYSMDGDFAPVKEIIRICHKYNAYLIIDEAHSCGVWDKQFEKLLKDPRVLARIVTYGKAFGIHGASILCSTILRDYLINFSRPLIYTTALSAHSAAAIMAAYKFMPRLEKERKQLYENIRLFEEKSKILRQRIVENKRAGAFKIMIQNGDSQIRSFIIPGNETVKKLASYLQKSGFDVRPILSPTVSRGTERIRICLHSYNTGKQINELFERVENYLVKNNFCAL